MSEKSEKKEVIIARVGDNFLYFEDVAFLLAEAKSQSDTSLLIKSFADNWVQTQLFLKEAEAAEKIDMDEIQRKTEAYKSQLLIHAYKQQYIESHLDTVITEEQITQFYTENQENFVLAHPIVSYFFVRMSNSNDIDVSDLKKWLQKSDEASLVEATDFCTKYAVEYNFDEKKWVDFSELSSLPIFTFKNSQNLPIKRIIEAKDSSYLYFWRINDVMQNTQVAPIAYARTQIAEIIINKRKADLQRNLETNLFKQAQENKLYEVFY
jgi:hypothetical protein